MSTPEVQKPEVRVPLSEQKHDVMPTLFGDGTGLYEVRKGSFVVSFLLNSAILALLIWAGSWTASHAPEIKQVVGLSVDVSPYIMPSSKTVSGGGGGGGSHDVNAASKGALPKFSKTQIAPPTVLPMEQPKLPVMPTVVVPPEIKMPQVGPMGDPLAKVMGPASNGTGTGGGIGSGTGGGVGSGRGPGVGPGWGGGIGGGAYHVGGGVSAPKVIYKVDPEFSDEARKNKWQGIVVLRVVIGTDGRTHEISVARSLGMGLDEKAVEAARLWRFEPGLKDGKPVPVEVNMEVNFHLY
ncbi:MAG TPA: energy transducer TonB [Candidatus Saccharimonadales bacterium]|nr:energy transducer TonB [Candidatus Saccharimonadales bacterium]